MDEVDIYREKYQQVLEKNKKLTQLLEKAETLMEYILKYREIDYELIDDKIQEFLEEKYH